MGKYEMVQAIVRHHHIFYTCTYFQTLVLVPDPTVLGQEEVRW